MQLKFIAVFKRFRHWSLSWTTLIQLDRLCCLSLISLILCHQHRRFRNRIFHLVFQLQCMYIWLPVVFIILLFIWLKFPCAVLLSVHCWVCFRPRCTLEQGLPNPGSQPKLGPREPSDGAWTVKIMKLAAFFLCGVTFFRKKYSLKELRSCDEFYFNVW
jgi:hypothetical protein